MHNGAQVWTTRIVIGKPSMPTPLLSETMKYHHRQSDLDRAAVDRAERIPAGAGAGSDGARAHGLARELQRRRRARSPSRRATAMRSAGSGSTSTTASRCIQHDTPDKDYVRRTRCAPTATAACACRIRPKYAEVLLNIARPSEHWTAERIQKHVRRRRAGPPAAADADLGAPDLSDRLRRQRRQAANAPRHLQSRQPHASPRSRANAATWRLRPSASARRSRPPRASRRRPPPGPAHCRRPRTPRRATPGSCRRRSSA